MGQLDDEWASATPQMMADWGESIIYTPAGGTPRPVDALVVRGVLEPVQEMGGNIGAIHHELVISRTDIAAINRQDSFTFANTQGGTATIHGDVQVDYSRTDAGAWTLKVR
jgi:hypothetical protein